MIALRSLCLGLVLVVWLLVPLPAWAAVSMLSVYPSRMELEVPAGESRTFSVTVSNPGKDALKVRSYLADWQLTTAGELEFLPPGKAAHSASKVISFTPAQFVLLPNQTQQVRVNIQVPAGMPAGEVQDLLFFETIPTQAPRRNGKAMISFNQRVGTTIYVGVPELVRQATVARLAYLPATGKMPERIGLALQNEGNMHVRLVGTLKVLRGEEIVRQAEISEILLVRDGRRLSMVGLGKPLERGAYQLRLTLEYGGEDVVEAESAFDK